MDHAVCWGLAIGSQHHKQYFLPLSIGENIALCAESIHGLTLCWCLCRPVPLPAEEACEHEVGGHIRTISKPKILTYLYIFTSKSFDPDTVFLKWDPVQLLHGNLVLYQDASDSGNAHSLYVYWIHLYLQVFVAVAGWDGLHCLLGPGPQWQVPAVGWTGVGVRPQKVF